VLLVVAAVRLACCLVVVGVGCFTPHLSRVCTPSCVGFRRISRRPPSCVFPVVLADQPFGAPRVCLPLPSLSWACDDAAAAAAAAAADDDGDDDGDDHGNDDGHDDGHDGGDDRYSHIRLVFHGSKADSSQLLEDTSLPSKGIVAREGSVDIHGKQFHPTWDRLATTASAGDNLLVLQSEVNWEVGQRVLVVTSAFYDCPANYSEQARWTDSDDPWCRSCWSWEDCPYEPPQNEERVVDAVDGALVRLDRPLDYNHFASGE
jgi:hypothetical protein